MVATQQISVDRIRLSDTARQVSLRHLHRVVYRHDWTSLDEWVGAVHALADLSDAAIDELTASGNQNPQ
jgi:hypothetical protein